MYINIININALYFIPSFCFTMMKDDKRVQFEAHMTTLLGILGNNCSYVIYALFGMGYNMIKERNHSLPVGEQ